MKRFKAIGILLKIRGGFFDRQAGRPSEPLYHPADCRGREAEKNAPQARLKGISCLFGPFSSGNIGFRRKAISGQPSAKGTSAFLQAPRKGTGSLFQRTLSPGSIFVVYGIDECQDFGDHEVNGRGNFLMEIKLGKNLNQSGILLNGHAMAICQFNDLLGDQARSFGRYFRSSVFWGVVPERHRLFQGFFCLFPAHLLTPLC